MIEIVYTIVLNNMFGDYKTQQIGRLAAHGHRVAPFFPHLPSKISSSLG